MTSLLELCRRMQRRAPDDIIGRRGEEVVTLGEFLSRVDAWHAMLQHTAGSNFALYLEDSIEFGAALLGAWHAGKTVWLSADTLAPSVDALRSNTDGFLGEFPPACNALLPSSGAQAQGDYAVPLAADFVGLVVHTSGTTGAAQAIAKKLSQLADEVATLEQQFGAMLDGAEIVATVSHQHIYGLLFRVLWPLTAGRVTHARSQNFPEQLAAVLAVRDCALIASPAHLKRLPEHSEWPVVAQHLRAVFSSGGPLAAEVAVSSAARLGRTPIEVYGSSETGGIAWRQRVAGADESWCALPQVEWRISDDDGLLEVRSPHLPDAEWFQLADRAEAQDGARFLLKGRSDRIVKVEEKRISLDAIENLLTASPLVAAIRVLASEEGLQRRQSLAAFLVLTEAGRELLAADGKLVFSRRLRQLLVGAIEPVGLPRRWRYLEQMPVNAQGKTTHAMLLALLDERPRELAWRELERTPSQLRLEATVPANLHYFDGHFSEVAVLPGVVQIDWAIAIGRRHFALPAQFRSIAALKFQHLIQPGNTIVLELIHDVQKNSLNFRYVSQAGQHASGRILFADPLLSSTATSPAP